MKKLLVISFTFPPYPGIGSRRWAKFVKYLHRSDVDVQVITAHRTMGDSNPWLRDTGEYRDRINYVNPSYPKILGTIPTTFFQKVRYRLALEYVKRKYREGNYFDPSSGFGNKIAPLVKGFIGKGYNNILITCGPFHMAYELLKMKQQNPNTNWILDFRDPWANNRTSFGFLTISEQQLKREFEMESESIQAADYVISVSDEMTGYFEKIGESNKEKFLTLENGFDREDLVVPVAEKKKNEILRFIFTGTVYEETRHIFKEFIGALEEIRIEHPRHFEKMRFDFYGGVPGWFAECTVDLQEVVKFHGSVGLNKVYEEIGSSDICMLFLTDDLAYSRSTKFYEYIAMNKPICVFSKGGPTGAFVEENDLGFACDTGYMKEKLLAIAMEWGNRKNGNAAAPDLSQWDIKNTVRRLEPILK